MQATCFLGLSPIWHGVFLPVLEQWRNKFPEELGPACLSELLRVNSLPVLFDEVFWTIDIPNYCSTREQIKDQTSINATTEVRR